MKPAGTFYYGTGENLVMVSEPGKAQRVLDPDPSLRVINHSPTGFSWGYMGLGPAQLALAILLDYSGDADWAKKHYQTFKERIIGVLNPAMEWQIYGSEITNLLGNPQ
jgi:hypothetical protein